MPMIRQDPTTKEWFILATGRAKRPHDFQKPIQEKTLPEFDSKCPFCPTNETMTPVPSINSSPLKNLSFLDTARLDEYFGHTTRSPGTDSDYKGSPNDH